MKKLPNEELLPERVMVDLETMGKGAGCAIVSIGAVRFDLLEEPGKSPTWVYSTDYFYRKIRLQSALDLGLTVDGETVAWWLNQDIGAIADLQTDRAGIVEVLHALSEWLAPGVSEVWGNGADFDNAILAYAYNVAGVPLPWKYWMNRCYRTISRLKGAPKAPAREGIYHRAIDDAVHQTKHLCHIFNAL